MQFTGLTDKNGKEIYEGDFIANVVNGITYEMIWLDSGFIGDERIEDLDPRIDQRITLTTSEAKEFEVIGNIKENPELLN
jgi:uncharacterized phage protein (TIGR01671 family)